MKRTAMRRYRKPSAVAKADAHGGPMMFARWLRRHHPEIAAMPNVPETAEQAVERMTAAKARLNASAT